MTVDTLFQTNDICQQRQLCLQILWLINETAGNSKTIVHATLIMQQQQNIIISYNLNNVQYHRNGTTKAKCFPLKPYAFRQIYCLHRSCTTTNKNNRADSILSSEFKMQKKNYFLFISSLATYIAVYSQIDSNICETVKHTL